MSKEAVFTMKLEPELRELMRDYVRRQQEAREYGAFLLRKVEAARGSMRAGRGRSDDEVETEFAARRAKVEEQA